MRATASNRATDALVVALGAWTLVCVAVVFAGGSARALSWATIATAAVLAGAWLVVRRGGAEAAVPGEREPGEDARSQLRIAGAVGVAVTLVAAVTTGSEVATWIAATATLALGVASGRGPVAAGGPIQVTRGGAALVLGLAVAGALFPLFVHRPDLDDAYYLRVARLVATWDPRPLFASDPLFEGDGLPLLVSIYRFNDYELLAGLVAGWTGLAPIEASHWVLPAVFGLFAAPAWARLTRLLFPERWMVPLVGTLAVLALTAETHRWYGNFAFVRLQQGKAAFLIVLLPLVCAYAIEHARGDGRRTWSKLALAQVASVGLTATAIWIVPAVAGLSMLGAMRWTRASIARLARGIAASAWPIAVGLYARADASSQLTGLVLPGGDLERPAGVSALRHAWDLVVGTGPFALLALAALCGAWTLAERAMARRWLAALPLGALLVFLNPWTAELVLEHVTGEITYFRSFWIVPLPLAIAVLLAGPATWPGLPRRAAPLLGAGLTGLALALLPAVHAPTVENRARVEWLGLKVEPDAWRAARRLRELSPPGATTLAPEAVTTWLGALPGAPATPIPRPVYLVYARGRLPEAEIRRRWGLAGVLNVEGRPVPEQALAWFAEALGDDRIAAVATLRGSRGVDGPLRAAGFRTVDRFGPYAVWAR